LRCVCVDNIERDPNGYGTYIDGVIGKLTSSIGSNEDIDDVGRAMDTTRVCD
jgi:hypothetical protein